MRLAVLVALLCLARKTRGQCQVDKRTTISCITEGDHGSIPFGRLCTICNLLLDEDGKFHYFESPPGDPHPMNSSISIPWKPATIFALYDFSAKRINEQHLRQLARGAAYKVLNTTAYIIPRLEGNFCHAINDVIAPFFWRVRQQQGTSFIDPDKVAIITLNDRMRAHRDVSHFLRYFSSFKHIENTNMPRGQLLHIREAVVGAYGMTIHQNQNYYWHGARYLSHPPFGMRSIYYNVHLLREHMQRAFDVPIVGRRVLSSDLIVVANRHADSRGRSALNAERLVEELIHRIPAHNVHPQVVYFEETPLEQLAELLSRTKVLIAPHGAGLSNMLFMRPGGAVVELIPFLCHRLRIIFAPLATALRLHYSFWQPTDSLVPDLPSQKKLEHLKLASSKKEPCPQSLSRTNFLVDPAQIADEVTIALEFVRPSDD